MCWLTRCFAALLLAAALVNPAAAQNAAEDVPRADSVNSADGPSGASEEAGISQERNWIVVELTTNLPEALVYADSAFVGTAAAERFTIPADVSSLRLVAPSLNSWTINPVSAPIDAIPGDTIQLDLDFAYHYRIESMPFGATVHLETAEGWTKLGRTPFHFTSSDPLVGTLVVERAGYGVERLEAGSKVWNRHSILLSPAEALGPEAAEVAWSPPRRHRNWIDYAAIGTAVAAGALAIHYKFKADNLFDDHRTTADPAMRDRIKSLDTRSGVAFGAMQAGLGLFALRLVLR